MRYFLKDGSSPLQTGADYIAEQALKDGYREVSAEEFWGSPPTETKKPSAKK